jgi:hypothetical protein
VKKAVVVYKKPKKIVWWKSIKTTKSSSIYIYIIYIYIYLFIYLFAQFYPKAVKSRFICVFNFALRES